MRDAAAAVTCSVSVFGAVAAAAAIGMHLVGTLRSFESMRIYLDSNKHTHRATIWASVQQGIVVVIVYHPFPLMAWPCDQRCRL